MEQVYFGGESVVVEKLSSTECWRCVVQIDGTEIKCEIEKELYNQEVIDFAIFEQFLEFIGKDKRLEELVQTSYKLIKELGLAFFKRCSEEISNWDMTFDNSIIFRGQPNGINKLNRFEYSLVFNFAEKKLEGYMDGDAYGLYLVDITDLQITGARRLQC